MMNNFPRPDLKPAKPGGAFYIQGVPFATPLKFLYWVKAKPLPAKVIDPQSGQPSGEATVWEFERRWSPCSDTNGWLLWMYSKAGTQFPHCWS